MRNDHRTPRSLVLLALALALSACPATPRAVQQPGARRGGTLRVLLSSDVDSLDPNRAASPSSWFFVRALFRGLLAFPNESGTADAMPVPDLATAMPAVSANGLRYTFHLRLDAAFGAPASRAITARDVVASITRTRASDGGIAPYLDVIARMSAPTPTTVVLQLQRPAPYLPWLLAQPQVAVVPAGTPLRTNAARISPSGPYRIATYLPERSLTLARNLSWRDDPVRAAYVDRIDATFGVPASRAVRLVASGAADILLDPGPPDQGPMALEPGERSLLSVGGCVRYLSVDASSPPFSSRAARLAVAAAVDRAALGPSPATRVLPPTVTGHDDAPVVPQSIARARAYLAHAGLAGGFTTTILAAAAPRDRREVATLRASLARAGIRVRAHLVDPALLPLAATAPLTLRSWCADWPGAAGADVLGPVGVGVADRAFRAALSRAERAPATDAAAWRDADAALLATAQVIPLQWPGELVALSARVRGLTGAPMWPRGDPANAWIEG